MSSDWIVDNSYSYAPNEKENISSRLYALIGSDNSGNSFVKIKGFGPELTILIKRLKELAKDSLTNNTEIILYPKDGHALGLLKEIANEAYKVGFKFGAEIKLRAINYGVDLFSDGTLMGHVEKQKKHKIAKILCREDLL
jgi:hypothetical protein